MLKRFRIAPISANDIKQVVSLLRVRFPLDLLEYTIYDCGGYELYVADCLCAPPSLSPSLFIGAYLEQRLCGYAEWRFSHQAVFLNNIFVAEDVAGCGLGAALFATGSSIAVNLGVSKMELDVFEDNNIAQDWYTRLGFRPTSRKLWGLVDIGSCSTDSTSSSGPVYVRDFPQALASYNRFGFCQFRLADGFRDYLVGMIGNHLFTTSQVELLERPEALETLSVCDRNRELLLCFLPEGHKYGTLVRQLTVSVRMTKYL